MNAKFKVGQKVKCVGTSLREHYDRDFLYGGAGWRKDKIFKIDNISCYFGRYCYWEAENDTGVWESHVELEGPKQVKHYGIVDFCKVYYK